MWKGQFVLAEEVLHVPLLPLQALLGATSMASYVNADYDPGRAAFASCLGNHVSYQFLGAFEGIIGSFRPAKIAII